MPRRSGTPCSAPPENWMTGSVDLMSRPSAPARVMLSLTRNTRGATRRSVYLQQRRTQTDSMLEVFDTPSIVTTCTRRSPSTIPLQSLCLLNSDFVMACARSVAKRLDRESACRTGGAFRSRVPHHEGLPALHQPGAGPGRANRRQALPGTHSASATSTNCRQSHERRSPSTASASDLCQMLLASNAFLYID